MSLPLIKEMTIDDYDRVIELWRPDPGVGLSDSDSLEALERYLADEHCLGLVAKVDDDIVATGWTERTDLVILSKLTAREGS